MIKQHNISEMGDHEFCYEYGWKWGVRYGLYVPGSQSKCLLDEIIHKKRTRTSEIHKVVSMYLLIPSSEILPIPICELKDIILADFHYDGEEESYRCYILSDPWLEDAKGKKLTSNSCRFPHENHIYFQFKLCIKYTRRSVCLIFPEKNNSNWHWSVVTLRFTWKLKTRQMVEPTVDQPNIDEAEY